MPRQRDCRAARPRTAAHRGCRRPDPQSRGSSRSLPDESIANAMNRAYEQRLSRAVAHLLADRADMTLEKGRVDNMAVSPDFLGKEGMGERLVRIPRQLGEDVCFNRGTVEVD